jgi:16S rRNA (guanine527-N7)-methyltransferase
LRVLTDVLAEQIGLALGPNEGPRLWERHVLDSLVPLDVVYNCRLVADVGSGAGLPGLPLAIACPWVRFTLVEPRRLRAAWLREATDRLGLTNVDVAGTTWEGAPRRRYDAVTARAVATPEDTLALLARGPATPRMLVYVAASATVRGARTMPSVVDNGRVVLDIGAAWPKTTRMG